ncbi:hypothetical protein F4808DRAFT_50587 [Astrocystis sublimbata]|nr:hypothetical protein F4808DRAFT_50587 [Astrocystis sublimbata]
MPRQYKSAACNTCRQRKLKCDETLPVCQRCSKASRYCDRSGKPVSISQHPYCNDTDIGHQRSSLWLNETPRKSLESPEITNYFRAYIMNVAPWYDLSDSQCLFSAEIPRIALGEPLLLCAVIALSAVYVSQTTAPSARAMAETYHTRYIRLFVNLDPEDVLIKKGVALASTCLLRSYEILAEDHDPNRHLKGAFSLASQLREFLDQPTGGLLHSGFWNYLREDITFSLFGNCPLKIKLDPIPRLSNISSDQDHLNAISLVLGRIINTMMKCTAEKISDSWDASLFHVKDWLSDLPPHFRPFSRANLTPLSSLPAVHMLKACHAASRHYCLVSIAILAEHTENTVQLGSLTSIALDMGFPTKMVPAREDLLEHIGHEVCGVAFTSNEPSVLVNAFGPISYCAKYIRKEASRQEVVRHLVASKKATGWPIQKIIANLQQHWSTIVPVP